MKTFSILLLAMVLSGCGMLRPKFEDNRPPPVVVTHKTVIAYTCPQPPQIDNFDARNIEWDVISRLELDGVMLELLSELGITEEEISIINQTVGDFFFMPEDEVLWALNTDEYTNLGNNTSEILAAIRQLKQVVIHYKSCIEDSERAVADQNAESTTEIE